jgi:hypothetical protein
MRRLGHSKLTVSVERLSSKLSVPMRHCQSAEDLHPIKLLLCFAVALDILAAFFLNCAAAAAFGTSAAPFRGKS